MEKRVETSEDQEIKVLLAIEEDLGHRMKEAVPGGGWKDGPLWLNPRIDYVFKRIFGSDDPKTGGLALRGLLSTVLGVAEERVTGLKVRSGDIPGASAGDKTIRLDLFVQLADGMKVNIEMQRQGAILELQVKRILFYLCKLYTTDVPIGFDYEDLTPVVAVMFTDRIYFPGDEEAVHAFRFATGAGELTDVLEVRIVEMGKARMLGSPSPDDRLGMWLQFLEFGERKEVSNMLSQKNPAIAQAVERLTEMSKDENEWMIAFERDKAQAWDAMNRYARKEHLRKASAQAEAEGMAKGLAEGLAEAKAECALRLLGLGLDDVTISEGTGLSVEEVVRIRSEKDQKSEGPTAVPLKDN